MLTPLILIKIAVAACVPVAVGGLVYLAISTELQAQLYQFLTSPGWSGRLLLVTIVGLNWKNLPLAWTIRVFHGYVYHDVFKRPDLPPRALFHYVITTARNSLLDTDYNLHKSNSTYFPDLDVSRTHLVSFLLNPGIQVVTNNARSQVVRDKQGRVMTGGFSLVLGSVFCSYRREVGMLQSYELWSRVLTWDRKWMYFVTHFVAKGKGKGEADRPERIIATAISKYVFKLDRFTVHPSIILETSGLLPERPGAGWRGGELEVGDINDELELTEGGGDWDWRRTELERRRGMQVAQKFAALDTVHTLFDGGKDGILGKFALG